MMMFNNFNLSYRFHAFNLMMIAARWYRGCWFNARVTHVLSLVLYDDREIVCCVIMPVGDKSVS